MEMEKTDDIEKIEKKGKKIPRIMERMNMVFGDEWTRICACKYLLKHSGFFLFLLCTTTSFHQFKNDNSLQRKIQRMGKNNKINSNFKIDHSFGNCFKAFMKN